MRPLSSALAAACLLAACTPASDIPASGPAPPADAPGVAAPAPPAEMEPLRALGTEPFWGLDIAEDGLTLEGPDRETLSAPNPGAIVQGGTSVWNAVTANGVALKVTLTTGECSDGMSDRRYPFQARIELAGEVLNGCAASIGEWPK
jgi:uncharacterized membrane protein